MSAVPLDWNAAPLVTCPGCGHVGTMREGRAYPPHNYNVLNECAYSGKPLGWTPASSRTEMIEADQA